ncbi:MAG: D-xylose transport system permease protein [Blastococcus sp.]|jgi:D-xylose transport system permease protein|nr:D-xylose transport system permease protein [Blastococcus sp.]
MSEQTTDQPTGSRPTTGGAGERASSFSLDVDRRNVPDALREYVGRLRSGEPGALPAVLGLVVLGIMFSFVSDRFFSESNIGNLPGQGAYIAIIALGLVFVLLLGEIDLAAGTTGGICAGAAAQALASHGLRHGIPGASALYWALVVAMVLAAALGFTLRAITGPVVVLVGVVITLTGLDSHPFFAMVFAVAIGAAVGIFSGWMVASVGIPSFIVTLALFLAWQGLLLFLLNSQPISVNGYPLWHSLAYDNMSPLLSWIFTIVVVGGYLGYTILKSLRAQARGLAADTMDLVLLRGGLIAVAGIVITLLANQNRNTNPFKVIQGLPWALTIPIILMIACTIALTKTTWGRHLFATGGNEEAARRAGINVTHIKVTAFTLSASFGALGGVFLASNTGGAQLDLGSGNILLFAVAAAVIGGTSLFGGRGKPRDALIGALVIVIIPNGIGLRPSLPASYQNLITGLVLLIAAAVDALSRRRSARR